MIDRIHAQRAALQAQLDHDRLVFADLEEARDQTILQIAALSRKLDAMAGGLKAYDDILATEDAALENGVDVLLGERRG